MSAFHTSTLTCLAPAKLNLFLHIIGRRADGYHQLQTAFQLLDWGDTLHFTLRNDNLIKRRTLLANIPEEIDLSVRAARLLQEHTGCSLGVEIEIDKRLPSGAGLGGGSSDAATTLLALNRLWGLHLFREQLQNLALSLGADVPLFIFGRNAFGEGVGEKLQSLDLPSRHFLIITPSIQVLSAKIFAAQELTRDTKNIRITDFLAQKRNSLSWPDNFGRNDMQPVVANHYPEVAQAIEWLSQIAPTRMTGSGASVFAAFPTKAAALAAQANVPPIWHSAVAASIERHPLFDFAQ